MDPNELGIYAPESDKPTRRSGAEARAGAAALDRAMADIFSRGYVLTKGEINTIGTYYGYAEKSAGLRFSSMTGPNAMRAFGVRLRETNYRHRSVFYDETIPIEHTDMEQVQVHIDEAINEQSKQRGFPGNRDTKRDSMLF